MPGAEWFRGSTLNFAENLLRRRDEHPALVFWNETGRQRTITYAELCREVGRMARVLKTVGVVSGDRVAGFVPNSPEAVVAMLAAAGIGAVWSSCSPDFGLTGALDRFGQISPRVLIAAPSYLYKGKTIDVRERLAGLMDRLPSVERLVLFPYASAESDDRIDASGRLEGLSGRRRRPPICATAIRSSAPHPLFVGDDWSPKGDRPRHGRPAGATPQGVVLHTDLAGRSHALHDDLRLDDVELAGQQPRGQRNGGALRRCAIFAAQPPACSTWRKKNA